MWLYLCAGVLLLFVVVFIILLINKVIKWAIMFGLFVLLLIALYLMGFFDKFIS